MTERLLLDLDEAASRLSVSRRTVQALVLAGELASVKVGRCRRIANVDLEAYVQRLRGESEPVQLAVVHGRSHSR